MLRELVVQLHECDIFAICETFLRDNDSLFIKKITHGLATTDLVYTPMPVVGQEVLVHLSRTSFSQITLSMQIEVWKTY